jgi:hypothetical protein
MFLNFDDANYTGIVMIYTITIPDLSSRTSYGKFLKSAAGQ